MSALYYGKLVDKRSRESASRACWELPDGSVVKIMEPTRTLEQNSRLHAQVRDVAEQWTFMGRHWDEETVKRLLVDAFVAAMADMGTPIQHQGHLLPSIDGKRIVQLGTQTANLSVKEMGMLMDFIDAWAAQEGIELHEE